MRSSKDLPRQNPQPSKAGKKLSRQADEAAAEQDRKKREFQSGSKRHTDGK